MMNRSIHLALQDWVKQRPGGLPGLIATICLTAAVLTALTQAGGRRACVDDRSRTVAPVKADDAEPKSAENRWRAEVSKMLGEILDRMSESESAEETITAID